MPASCISTPLSHATVNPNCTLGAGNCAAPSPVRSQCRVPQGAFASEMYAGRMYLHSEPGRSRRRHRTWTMNWRRTWTFAPKARLEEDSCRMSVTRAMAAVLISVRTGLEGSTDPGLAATRLIASQEAAHSLV